MQEHPKASFLDSKAPKSLVNQGKNRCRFLRVQEAVGSNPATPTKTQRVGLSHPLCFDKNVMMRTHSIPQGMDRFAPDLRCLKIQFGAKQGSESRYSDQNTKGGFIPPFVF